MTPNDRILFYYKNGGICKKRDLNIFKIDWVIAILGFIFFFFWFKGGEAIVNSKHFVKDHLGLDIIINQSV